MLNVWKPLVLLITLTTALGLGLLPATSTAAAGPPPTFTVLSLDQAGCDSDDTTFNVDIDGLNGVGHTVHTTVIDEDGLLYMNEDVDISADLTAPWSLYTSTSYGPTNGTWPLPTDQHITATITVERPKGNILWSWTTVLKSCQSGKFLYNGPTAQDGDRDFVPALKDACPTLQAFTKNGCPTIARTLTLKSQKKFKLRGKLKAPGHTRFAKQRKVIIWKVRTGKKDQRVATIKTNRQGVFTRKVKKTGKGRYYATTPAVTIKTQGTAKAKKSTKVRAKK